MAYDYSEVVAEALTLISEFGREVVFHKEVSVPVDPAKPWTGSSTTIATMARDAVFVPAAGTEFGTDVVTEEMLRRVSKVCLVGQTPSDLNGFHKLVDGSVTYLIDWVQELRPGSEVVLYYVGVKL